MTSCGMGNSGRYLGQRGSLINCVTYWQYECRVKAGDISSQDDFRQNTIQRTEMLATESQPMKLIYIH
jgi:hypothetical protein